MFVQWSEPRSEWRRLRLLAGCLLWDLLQPAELQGPEVPGTPASLPPRRESSWKEGISHAVGAEADGHFSKPLTSFRFCLSSF